MGLVTAVLRLPFLPVEGVIKLAEIIRDEAEREYYSPAAVRRDLEEYERAAEAGEISDEELIRRQHEAIGRLIQPRPPVRRTDAADEEG